MKVTLKAVVCNTGITDMTVGASIQQNGRFTRLIFQCIYCKNGDSFHQVLTYIDFPDSCLCPILPLLDLTFPVSLISH